VFLAKSSARDVFGRVRDTSRVVKFHGLRRSPCGETDGGGDGGHCEFFILMAFLFYSFHSVECF
jgi:hypothetical protein